MLGAPVGEATGRFERDVVGIGLERGTRGTRAEWAPNPRRTSQGGREARAL